MIQLLYVAAVAFAGFAGYREVKKLVSLHKTAGDESSVEDVSQFDVPGESIWLVIPGDQKGENVRLACEKLIGAPYVWGGPNFQTLLDGDLDKAIVEGLDCSGSVSTLLRHLGMVNEDFCYHRTTGDMASACDAITEDEVEPGDICYYGGHVVMVVGRDKTGKPYALSMSGGDHTTTSVAIAEKQGACGKIRACDYMTIVCYMRPKAEFRT